MPDIDAKPPDKDSPAQSGNTQSQGSPEKQEDLTPPSIVKEFFLFLKEEKIWWLAPMLIILLLVGIVVVIGQSSPALAPFLYPLF